MGGRGAVMEMYKQLLSPSSQQPAAAPRSEPQYNVFAAALMRSQATIMAGSLDAAASQRVTNRLPQTALEKHTGLITQGVNQSVQWFKQNLVWIDQLPDDVPEIPSVGDETIFTCILNNKNLTHQERANLIRMFFDWGYKKFYGELLKPTLLEKILEVPQFFSLLGECYYHGLWEKQLDLLDAPYDHKTTVEENIWKRFIVGISEQNGPSELFAWLQDSYSDNVGKLLRYTRIWFTSCATTGNIIDAHESIKPRIAKTLLAPYEALLMKLAKQAILYKMIMSTEKCENEKKIEDFLGIHRYSFIYHIFIDPISKAIYAATLKNDRGTALALYNTQEEEVQRQLAAVPKPQPSKRMQGLQTR